MPERPVRESLEARVRRLEREAVALGFRVSSLERTRDKYVPLVDALTAQETVEKAVKDAFSKTEVRGWSKKERLAGFVIAYATVASLVLQVGITLYHAATGGNG